MWFILALASAALSAFRRVGEKKLLTRIDNFTLGWLVQLASLPLLIIILISTSKVPNPLHLGPNFWLPFLGVTLIFYPLNTWLFYSALNKGALSEVLPVQSLLPALTMILGYIVLRERPASLSVLGAVVVVIGLYVLNMTGKTFHNPFRSFTRGAASFYMLASTCAVALVTPIDKIAIQASNPIFFTVTTTLGATIVLYIIASYRDKTVHIDLRGSFGALAGIGSVQGLSFAAYIGALSLASVGSVGAVKSTGALIGAIAGIIFLKEPITWQKSVAFILILIGLVAIAR
jgi:uncharacterized membrane protein